MKSYWKHRKDKWGRHQRRRWRIRKHIAGTEERPRLLIRKTGRHIYAQVINDAVDAGGFTLLSASTNQKNGDAKKNCCNIENAATLGKEIGTLMKQKGIETVVFDRGGYRYHGIVKTFAEAVREAGITI